MRKWDMGAVPLIDDEIKPNEVGAVVTALDFKVNYTKIAMAGMHI